MSKQSCIVNTKTLIAELGWATRFADKKTTIPILANVLVENGPGGITFTGNNLEISGQTTMDSTGDPFAIAVPTKKLLAFLKKAEGKDVALTAKGMTLTAQDGDAAMTVHGMSKDAFPVIPEAGPLVAEISGLKQAVPRAMLAIAEKESRFTLNAALLSLSEKGPDLLVGTDGRRLSMAGLSTNYAGKEPFRALLSKDALHELWWLEVDRVQFWSTEPSKIEKDNPRYLQFGVGPRRFIWASGVTGNFPEYDRVVPKDYAHTATLETARFKKALERAALMSDERSGCVRLEIAGGRLTVKSSISETGEARDSLAAPGVNGAKWESGFNSNYLLQALPLCPESVEFRFNDSIPDLKAVGLVTDGWHYVIMPMRV